MQNKKQEYLNRIEGLPEGPKKDTMMLLNELFHRPGKECTLLDTGLDQTIQTALAKGIEAVYNKHTNFFGRLFSGICDFIGHLIALPFRAILTVQSLLLSRNDQHWFTFLSPIYWRRNFLPLGKTLSINDFIRTLRNKKPSHKEIYERSIEFSSAAPGDYVQADASVFNKCKFICNSRRLQHGGYWEDTTHSILQGVLEYGELESTARAESAEAEKMAKIQESLGDGYQTIEIPSFFATTDDLVCPITQETFTDPVTTVDGHTYNRAGIERWFNRRQALWLAKTSPLTNRPLDDTTLTYNGRIMNYIKAHTGNDIPGMLASFLMPAPASDLRQDEGNNAYVVMHALWIGKKDGAYVLEPSANQDPPEGLEGSKHVVAFKNIIPEALKGKTLKEAVALIKESAPAPAPPPPQSCCTMM